MNEVNKDQSKKNNNFRIDEDVQIVTTIPENGKNAIILFSGGIDSTLTAIKFLEMGYNVNLITYNNGSIQNIDKVKWKIIELIEKYGSDKIFHQYISLSGYFKKYVLDVLTKDIIEYNTNFVCLGCRLLMHLYTMKLAMKWSITIVADGSNQYQYNFIEQNPLIIKQIQKVYKNQKINYIAPIYYIKSKKEVKEQLIIYTFMPKSVEGNCLFEGIDYTDDDIKNGLLYMKNKLDKINMKINTLDGEPERNMKSVIFTPSCIIEPYIRAGDLYKKSIPIQKKIANISAIYNIGQVYIECPENCYEGFSRPKKEYQQYNIPEYRDLCSTIAKKVYSSFQERIKSGIHVIGLISVDGSPTCGCPTVHEEGHIVRKNGILIEEIKKLLPNLKIYNGDIESIETQLKSDIRGLYNEL